MNERAGAGAPPAALPELDRECGTCDGHGVVTTPEWLEWRKREEAAESGWRAQHPTEPWTASAQFDALADEQPDPEMDCRECAGTGYVVTEAGREVLLFLIRHGKG